MFEHLTPIGALKFMDQNRRHPLNVINIAIPCQEEWEGMTPDEKGRFCAKCQHSVRNSSDISEREIDEALHSGKRVCMRLRVDPEKGVLTREGWIPRMVTIGVAAVAVAGCSKDIALQSKPTEAQTRAQEEAFRAMQDATDDILVKLHLKEAPHYLAGAIAPIPYPLSKSRSAP